MINTGICLILVFVSFNVFASSYYGDINGYDITMDLDFDGDKIHGSYSYNKYGKKIPLVGSVIGSKIELKTLGLETLETFYGYVSFYDPKTQGTQDIEVLSGYWLQAGAKKTKSFFLQKGDISSLLNVLTKKTCEQVWRKKKTVVPGYKKGAKDFSKIISDCVKIGRLELQPSSSWGVNMSYYIWNGLARDRISDYEKFISKLFVNEDRLELFEKSQREWKNYVLSSCRLSSKYATPEFASSSALSWGGEAYSICELNMLRDREKYLREVFTYADQDHHL